MSRFVKLVGEVVISLATLLQPIRICRPFAFGNSILEQTAFYFRSASIASDAKRAPDIRLIAHQVAFILVRNFGEHVAFRKDRLDELVEIIRIGFTANKSQCFAKIAIRILPCICQGGIARELQEFRLFFFLNHAEMRSDICFKGEEMEKSFTKGMDGLNFQTAGRLDCTCKEPACECKAFGGKICSRSPDLRFQGLIIKGSPFGQRIENAERHIRCSRLRESEAQDA